MAKITPQQRDSLMSQARAIQTGIDRLKQSGTNSKPVAPESNKRVRKNSIPIATTDIQTKTSPLPTRDMNSNLANQGILQAQQVSAKFQPMEGSFEAQKQDVNDNVLSILQQQIEGLSNVENNRVTSAESFRQAQNESGILQKQERSNQLQGQLNEVVSRGQANQLAVVGQGRGIPEAILGGQQAQFARETSIESLPISAQLSAAQGDLEMAQRNVETLFKIKTEDAKVNYDFNVKVINMVSEFATGQENAKLSDIKMKEERKYKEIERGYTELSNASQMAFANGQSALGGKINQLDYKSPTFKADLAKLQGQLKDPMQALDIALKSAQLEQVRTDLKASLGGQLTSDAQLDSMTNQIEDVKKLKNTSINGVFGEDLDVLDQIISTSKLKLQLKRGSGQIRSQSQDYISSVENMLDTLTLQTFAEAKAKGMTFGAMSEGEWKIIAKSATRLTQRRITNKDGRVIGYTGSKDSFRSDIDDIARRAEQSFSSVTGSAFISEPKTEDEYIESIMPTLQGQFNPYANAGIIF